MQSLGHGSPCCTALATASLVARIRSCVPSSLSPATLAASDTIARAVDTLTGTARSQVSFLLCPFVFVAGRCRPDRAGPRRERGGSLSSGLPPMRLGKNANRDEPHPDSDCCTESSSPAARAPGPRPPCGLDQGELEACQQPWQEETDQQRGQRSEPRDRESATARARVGGTGRETRGRRCGLPFRLPAPSRAPSALGRALAGLLDPSPDWLGASPDVCAGASAAGALRRWGARWADAAPGLRSSANPSAPKRSSSRSRASSVGLCNSERRRAAISPAVETCVSASRERTPWSSCRVFSLGAATPSTRTSRASRTGASCSSLSADGSGRSPAASLPCPAGGGWLRRLPGHLAGHAPLREESARGGGATGSVARRRRLDPASRQADSRRSARTRGSIGPTVGPAARPARRLRACRAAAGPSVAWQGAAPNSRPPDRLTRAGAPPGQAGESLLPLVRWWAASCWALLGPCVRECGDRRRGRVRRDRGGGVRRREIRLGMGGGAATTSRATAARATAGSERGSIGRPHPLTTCNAAIAISLDRRGKVVGYAADHLRKAL